MAESMQTGDAFEGVAPPSTSASKKVRYEVFINHRGPDTKYELAFPIYKTLNDRGVKVFLDVEELELGDSITAEIQEAMHSSFLHIAIFSPNYAQSPWCLAELSFMLKTGRTIIPVFYNVEPSDVRYAKGPFAKAFAEYEEKKRCKTQKLEEWKLALSNISFLHGQVLKGNDDERRLLKSIVNCVMKHMKKEVQLEVAKYPTGLDEAADDFESMLDSSQKIQIVGIVGMGGSGKTTLAKEIYNRKSSFIDKSSFIFDVRDATSKKKLYKKQKKLLQDIGEDTSQIDNLEDGKRILKRRLRLLQVFLILDDVDTLEQLNALLPGINSFGQGSLIIVTSRELGVLKSWRISSIYQMKGLNIEHARELLCQHAFLKSSPPDEFQDLVEKFVQICNGLPLSLEIFGGLLYSKSKEYWKSQLTKASRLLPDNIKGRLMISFDALDEEEKDIFLDIACFFIGEEKNLAIAVWDGSGWSGVHSWEVLQNKCLVDVDKCNQIKMHDQLRDLGREIAKGRSPYRIWSTQQITDIQIKTAGMVVIRGIKAATDDFYEECSYNHGTPFEECVTLVRSCFTPSILVVQENYFTRELAKLLPGLVWLRWTYIPETTLPSWLKLFKKLRVLELPNAEFLEELWDDSADPPLELTELNLQHAQSFFGFPSSIGRLKHLKKISLEGLYMHGLPMDSLPEEFCLLESLEHLQLSKCSELTSLPRNFGHLTNLLHLDLSYCRKLRMLPDSFKQLINLQYINFHFCRQLRLTPENDCIMENMTKLNTIDFSACENLDKLPQHITNQLSLTRLNVKGTRLRELPSTIGELSKLEELIIESDFLTGLPISIGNLPSLTSLDIYQCGKLETLPESIGYLPSLISLKISSCNELKTLPESIGHVSSLTNLEIRGCDKLETLPESMKHLSSLTTLYISGCRKLGSLTKNLGSSPEPVRSLDQLEKLSIKSTLDESLTKTSAQLCKLQSLIIRSCPISEFALLSVSSSFSLCNLKQIDLFSTLVSRISISQQCCPRLETLELHSNELLVEIETLPISIKTIKLSKCEMLKGINVLSGMVNLETLSIRDCGDKLNETADQPKKIQGLESCRSLEKERALSCCNMPDINLEHMERLRRLELSGACYISAIEPCLQTIKKWPLESIIFARTQRGVESVIESFAYPDLAFVDSCVETTNEEMLIGELRLKGGLRRCPNAAAMVCFDINSTLENTTLEFNYKNSSSSFTVGEGKWVCLGVFTQPSLMTEEYTVHELYTRSCELRRGMLVMDEQERVVEAFKKFLSFLRGCE